jgi:hypothetical protein
MTASTATPELEPTPDYRVRVVLEYRERDLGTAWTALDITDAAFSNADMTSPTLSDEAAFRLAGHLSEAMAGGLALEGHPARCFHCGELPANRLHTDPARIGYHPAELNR